MSPDTVETSPPTCARLPISTLPFTVEAVRATVAAIADFDRTIHRFHFAEFRLVLDDDFAVHGLGFVGDGAAADAHVAVHGAQVAVGLAGIGFDTAVDRGKVSAVARERNRASGPGNEHDTCNDDNGCKFHDGFLRRTGLSHDLTREPRSGLQVGEPKLRKKKPRFRGAHWSLACLFVEECFRSSCSCPMRSLSSRL